MKNLLLIITACILAVSAQTGHAAVVDGFEGPYAPGEWIQELPDPAFGGSIEFLGTTTLIISGPEGDVCSGGEEVKVSVTIPQTGQISFNYEVDNQDSWGSGFDFFIVRKTENGDSEELYNISESGTYQFSALFEAGDVLEIGVYSTDCILGELIAIITNFSGPSAPQVPLSSLSVLMIITLIGGFTIFKLR